MEKPQPFRVDRELWIASDLHLASDSDDIARAWIDFLEHSVSPGDVLVLAGDIFDAFAGYKKVFLNRFAAVLRAVHGACARGAVIHVLEGNHDIYLQAWVASLPGATLHGRGVQLEWGQRRVWIEHGDQVNATDYGYRALRLLFRSPLMRGWVAYSPDRAFDAFAQLASRSSRGAHPWLPEQLPATELASLRRIYREAAAQRLLHDADCVVYGHCHDLDEVRFTAGDRPVQYINMGYPAVHGAILRGRVSGEFLERHAIFGRGAVA